MKTTYLVEGENLTDPNCWYPIDEFTNMKEARKCLAACKRIYLHESFRIVIDVTKPKKTAQRSK